MKGFATIKNQAGSPKLMDDGRIICSSLHPAFAMRENRQFTQIIRDNIARAAEIAKRGHIDWKEPDYEYFVKWPTQDIAIARIEELCALFVKNKAVARLKCDIETDSIIPRYARLRCVGLGMELSGVWKILTVPFLWRDGREYWASTAFRQRAEAATQWALEECELTFHNGLYDTSVMLERGLFRLPKKQWMDTMLLHRNTDGNDLPHDLGFVVRQYTEAPLWKGDVDHKVTEAGVSDAEYHLYNSRDVYGTGLIEEPLQERVVNCGNVPQFRLDSALAPIARDMGRLGVFIDEHERGDLSQKFNQIIWNLTGRIRTLVNRPDFNPRSVPQVKSYLYDEKGYMPPLNTDGYEFTPGDDPSTSTPSLMKLADTGVDQTTATFLDSMLEYRACDALRRVTDKLNVYYDNLDDLDVAPSASLSPPLFGQAATTLNTLVSNKAPAVIIDGQEIISERPAVSWMPISWKIHVVPGGRWVCEPTIQNWTARGWMVGGKATNMRKMLIAPPGHVIVGADYEQIELRIYAVIANDMYVLKAFKDGLEPHCLNAATIMAEREDGIMPLYHELHAMHLLGDQMKKNPSLNTPENKETVSKIKYIRTIAKRVVYLKNYGGEADKLFSAMSSERDKATGKRVFPGLAPARVAEWEERWEKRHPETKLWHRRVHDFVRRNGYAQTSIFTRRKRFFVGGPNKKNAPPNHEIQGAASEMTNQAILRVAEEIPFGKWSRYTGLALQVHDYLGVFVPESRAEEAKEILERCMFHSMQTSDGWKMPFPAVAIASKTWADNA